MANSESVAKLDLSDVEHRLGQKVGGGQLWEPCNKTDIRRWVITRLARISTAVRTTAAPPPRR